VYFRSHGRDSGHAGAINAIVANVDKELDGAEQWTAFCLKVDSLLQEFRSLKTFGNTCTCRRSLITMATVAIAAASVAVTTTMVYCSIKFNDSQHGAF